MSALMIDTSVYIPFLRKGVLPTDVGSLSKSTIYLSAVVAQELLAGAGDDVTLQALKRLCKVFIQNHRLITPLQEDWLTCGGVLLKLGRKYGFESIKRGRLVNDVLIALSCQRAGSTLLTYNEKDFKMIRHFAEFNFSCDLSG